MEPRESYRLVSPTELPYAHNPYRCAHRARYVDLLRAECGLAPDGPWPSDATRSNERAAGRSFDASLSCDDRAACPYHRGDWQLAASAAITALGEAEDWDPWGLRDCFEQLALDEATARWAESLLTHPIRWAEGAEYLTNGQHRACALRHSGAPAVPVLTP